MNWVLSVDPGIRGCGVALWESYRLIQATYVRNPVRKGQSTLEVHALAAAVREWMEPLIPEDSLFQPQLVIECPVVYGAAFQKGDQNKSIIPLTLVVGAIAMCRHFTNIIQYKPRDWKGTADPDDVVIPLIKDRLSKDEHTRVILPSKSLAHNVWDGIGIGLKYLGRLEPKRVFKRERS